MTQLNFIHFIWRELFIILFHRFSVYFFFYNSGIITETFCGIWCRRAFFFSFLSSFLPLTTILSCFLNPIGNAEALLRLKPPDTFTALKPSFHKTTMDIRWYFFFSFSFVQRFFTFFFFSSPLSTGTHIFLITTVETFNKIIL